MPTDINRSIVSMVYPACIRFTSVVAHMISQLFHLVNVSMKNVFPFIYLKNYSLQRVMRLDMQVMQASVQLL